MKNFLFTILIFAFSNSFSQEVYNLKEVDRAPMVDTLQKSSCQRCFENALQEYIRKNIDIMKVVAGSDLKTSYLQFVIDTEGRMQGLQIRSKNKPLKKKLFKVFKNFQAIKPASIKNKPHNATWI